MLNHPIDPIQVLLITLFDAVKTPNNICPLVFEIALMFGKVVTTRSINHNLQRSIFSSYKNSSHLRDTNWDQKLEEFA